MAPTMPKKKARSSKNTPKVLSSKSQRKARSSKNTPKIEVSEEDRLPGVVYIGHIPHGFYEYQLRDYFSQFGKVLELKLSRSKKTGNSKGYAFVKFQYAAVAKTVAETCHNYLFFNKLLKCEYKPLSDIHPHTFFHYHMKPNRRPKRLHNQAKDEGKIVSTYKEMVGKQKKKMKQLRALGLDVDLDEILEINKSGLPSKTADQTSKQETPAVASSEAEPEPSPSEGKVKAASKRKAQAMEADSPSAAKISPKAKRVKKSTIASTSTGTLQTKKSPSKRKVISRAGAKTKK